MIAITGATGFLGQALLRQLRSRGDEVRAVVRPTSDRGRLEGYCSEVTDADLGDPASLAAAFEGADAVIHSAGLIEIRRGQADRLHRVNVEGTANVIEACRLSGVRRLVYISSIEALDLNSGIRPVTEDCGLAGGDALMDYSVTKAEASRRVAEAGKSGHPETVLICPTAIYGPWDYHGSLLTGMFRKVMADRLPAAIRGGFDWVDVRDVAGAVVAALTRGRSGEMYLTSGHYVPVSDLLEITGEVVGRRRYRPVLPAWIAGASGEICEAWSRLFGTPVLFTRSSIALLQEGIRVNSAKAERDLGYRARPAEDSVRDTVAWLRGEEEIATSPCCDPA